MDKPKDCPRVYVLADAVLSVCNGHLDLDRLTRFVDAYQEQQRLGMGEIWALPTVLRMVLLRRLSRAAVRIVEGHAPDDEEAPSLALLADDASPDDIVANCVRSLRTIAAHDWRIFFEATSRVEKALRTDPAALYPTMDFDTRDRCRKVVEDLAFATRGDEEEIAQLALRLARATTNAPQGEHAPAAAVRLSHVGYYLIGEGRLTVEEHLGYKPVIRERARRLLLTHPASAYFGGIPLLTAAALVGVGLLALGMGGTLAQSFVAILLFSMPAWDLAIKVMHWCVTHILPPRVLPKLDPRQGIRPENATIVVIPALLNDPGEVPGLLRQLELHYLGNTDPYLSFALLTDFADAPQEAMPGDAELLGTAVEGVRALNRQYARERGDPFYLFHRDRKWNPSEKCWMGWERKRGKLAEFNQFLLGKDDAAFAATVGRLDALAGVRYVVTVDADTALPRGNALALVATMAHPLNRPELDRETGRLAAGYSILQPRVEIRPESANRSPFTRIFSGESPVDLYSRAVSDVYHDLFGEGIYIGKGIYDVEAFARTTEGRVPETRC